MSFKYKDFFPEVLSSGFFSTEHESLTTTVVRANQWVEACKVRVINLETVVLPNIRSAEEAGEIGIRTSGEVSSHWYQVVRVWYAVEPPPLSPTVNA